MNKRVIHFRCYKIKQSDVGKNIWFGRGLLRRYPVCITPSKSMVGKSGYQLLAYKEPKK